MSINCKFYRLFTRVKIFPYRSPQEIDSGKIGLYLTFSANWNKREFISKVAFTLPSPSSMLNLHLVPRVLSSHLFPGAREKERLGKDPRNKIVFGVGKAKPPNAECFLL